MLSDDAIPPAENQYAPPPPVLAEPAVAQSIAAEAVVVRPPRVWPVFVLFFLVLTVGQTAASMVLVAVAALQYGLPALAQNPAQVVADAMYSGAAMLSAMLVNQTVVGAAALAAALLSPIGRPASLMEPWRWPWWARWHSATRSIVWADWACCPNRRCSNSWPTGQAAWITARA
jgi:hypothetical protein